jgi:cytoskeletal protein CcmA (bactofilin family)
MLNWLNNKNAKTPVSGSVPSRNKAGMIPSVISADMHVLGSVVSDGMLDIDGKIDGNIRCRVATIRPNGKVRGDVLADTVHIHGEIEGLIKARSVHLYAGSRVQGTIMHESLSVEDGALIDGKFKRNDKVFSDEDDLSRPSAIGVAAASAVDFENDNDNQEPVSAEELKLLENLRLIS